MSKKSSKENLTPTQKNVKRGRPLFYDGPHKNADPKVARDIVSMYVTCGMGYSAIRHVIGHKNDKFIEDVIRQHMFGRKNVKGDDGEIYCPGSSTLHGRFKDLVQYYVHKYGTNNDPYVIEMMTTGKCGDDPAYNKKLQNCPKCGEAWHDRWVRCPICEWRKDGAIQKKLF